LAVIDVESKFQYGAVSPAGARGIMQILPDVAKSLVERIGPHQLSHAKSFRPEFLDDPVLNIKLGVYYLHDLKKSFPNLTHALTPPIQRDPPKLTAAWTTTSRSPKNIRLWCWLHTGSTETRNPNNRSFDEST